ncbi:hypothetical protein U1Q18_046688 [Sarracenia purpurea var. burkii]
MRLIGTDRTHLVIEPRISLSSSERFGYLYPFGDEVGVPAEEAEAAGSHAAKVVLAAGNVVEGDVWVDGDDLTVPPALDSLGPLFGDDAADGGGAVDDSDGGGGAAEAVGWKWSREDDY